MELREEFNKLKTILEKRGTHPKSKSKLLFQTSHYIRRLESISFELRAENIHLKSFALAKFYQIQSHQTNKYRTPYSTMESK